MGNHILRYSPRWTFVATSVLLLLAGGLAGCMGPYDDEDERTSEAQSDASDERLRTEDTPGPLCVGGVVHPSDLLPRTGGPEGLPGDWGRLSITPSLDPKIDDDWAGHLNNYRTVFVGENRSVQFHGFIFTSSEAARPFFANLGESLPERHWDPALGTASVAWIESETSFHVISEQDGFVLHLEERRSDGSVGPWPGVSLHAAAKWLEQHTQAEC